MRKQGRNRTIALAAATLAFCSGPAVPSFAQTPGNLFAPPAVFASFSRLIALSLSVPSPFRLAFKIPAVEEAVEAVPPAILPPPSGRIVIKADYKERLDNRITASGNAEIRSGDIILCADQIVFDETTKDALAVGHVSLIRPDEAFTADRFALNMETGLGRAENVIGLVQPEYRYESAEVEREGPDEFKLGSCTVTGCSQPVPRWTFSASRAELRRGEYIKMWNPVFKIKDVPVFYLPYLKYPLNQDRATGFLIPRAGYSKRKGFTLSQQFYWAIARNMDATVSLDYYAAKGLGGGLDFRYLFGGGWGGRLNAFYFTYQAPATGVKPDDAILLRWSHNQPIPGNINLVANIDYQNSFSFSREFDNNFGRALTYNRSSQVYLTKSWGMSNFSVRLSRFETTYPQWTFALINQSLPQVSFSLFKRKFLGPSYFSLEAGYDSWQYGYTDNFKNGTETRSSVLSLSPRVSLPFNEIPWLGFDLSASGNLNYYGNGLDPATSAVVDKGFLSGNGAFSVTMTGPVFYRIFDFRNSTTRLKHVIEPSVKYRYDTPTIDADRIITPARRVFHYHYLEYGLQNQVLIKKGEEGAREVLSWRISQVFYLDEKNSPLSWYRLEDGSIPRFSEVESTLRFFPAIGIDLDVSLGYNTYKKMLSTVRASAGLGALADGTYLSVSWYKSINPYSGFTIGSRHQLGLRGGGKLPGLRLEALGELEYNLEMKKVLYTGLAAVWHVQCIDLRMGVRAYFFRETPDIQLQFSLGLGNIGSTSDFLGGRDL